LDYFFSYFITDVTQSYIAENEIFRIVADRNNAYKIFRIVADRNNAYKIFRIVADRNNAYKILARKALETISLATLRGKLKDLKKS
jgi:ribosomal protein S4E